jgi:Arc/MetJ family transcription regulator
MSTRKTSVAVDEDLALQAQKALGTQSLRATIDAAFREVIRARARADEVRSLHEMTGLDLDQPEVMRGAWDRS